MSILKDAIIQMKDAYMMTAELLWQRPENTATTERHSGQMELFLINLTLA